MIRMSENKEVLKRVRCLAGVPEPMVRPEEPFSEERIEFLNALSARLRKDPGTARYTDVAAFAFWCRKANTKRLAEQLTRDGLRIGKGLVFHIAPSNVPVNFAYSLALGLLSGNANIVRVSSKPFPQVDLICEALEALFAREEYAAIRACTSVVSYGHDKEVTDYYSGLCDMRVIWGGDASIRTIRESMTQSRCGEIAFADRYSFGIIRPSAVMAMDEEVLRQLAVNFYNDTYLLDQNACSTPHLIVWLTDREAEKETRAEAAARFWQAVYQAAASYDLADIKVSGKYDALCNFLADRGLDAGQVQRYDNRLYVLTLSELPKRIDELRGSFGMFFQYALERLDDLVPHITKKVQTAAVCGVERREITELILRGHLQGIDRVVGFGQTLDMGTIWDGYDIIGDLTRIIG